MVQYKLMGLSPGFEGKEFSFDDRLTIGRSDDNSIVVKTAGVSRHHTEINIVGRKVIIKDLGSANGTKVNGELCLNRELFSGDRITIGEMEFVFVAPAEARASKDSTRAGSVSEAAEQTAFIDMSTVGAGREGKPSEPASPPESEATSFVDMREFLDARSEQAQKPQEQATEYIDMTDAMNVDEAADSGATSFIDMSQIVSVSPDDKSNKGKPSPFVLVEKAAGVERKYEITWGSTILGKDTACDIVLTDPSISARHAKLIYDGVHLQIEDAGSASGVFVNLERVSTSRIAKPGDEILLGRATFYVRRAVSEGTVMVDLNKPQKKGFFAWLLGLFGIGK